MSALNNPSGPRAGYVLALLTASYAVNFLDRQVVNILAQSIKNDLQISDTQLGLLTGTAFGLFYATLGVPIAYLADRVNRVRIITVAIALWSAFTAACGAAVNYTQLFLLRLGVGIGEAGGTPPAQSLLADLFKAQALTMAMATFALGIPLGSFLGFLLGGIVNDLWGWRMAFVVAGVPGLLLALLIHLTVREPPRGFSQAHDEGSTERPRFLESVRGLLHRKSIIRLILGGTCGIFMVYVTNAWLPVFFIRVHHLSTSQVGGLMALCVGVGGLVGSLGAGAIATKLRKRFARADVWVISVTVLLTGPALLATLFAKTTAVALCAMFVLYVLAYSWGGPTSALIQRAAPLRSRSLAAGLQLSIATVIALLLGPPSVGYLSDRWHPDLGAESIRYALACAAVVSVVGSALYLLAAKHLSRDISS